MDNLKTALEACTIPFKHIAWSKAPNGSYGTWHEAEKHWIQADNKNTDAVTTAYVDLFTKTDSASIPQIVETAMNSTDCSWYCDTIQFEEDTGYIHYTWVVEALG